LVVKDIEYLLDAAGFACSFLFQLHVRMQWLDECIRLRQEAAQQQQQPAQPQQQADGHAQQQESSNGSAAGQGGMGALFAPVVGGGSEAERERSAKAAAERDVAGETVVSAVP
jgi:queuine/archaeosine tRNA-ribosyltransferase